MASAVRYAWLPRWVRAEPKIETAGPSSASRPNPSTNSAWIRSTRQGSVCTQSAVPRRSSSRWSVAGALGEALEHEQARHAERAAGEGPREGSADADRPGGRLAAGQFGAGLGVDDVGGRGEDGARAEHGAPPYPGPADHHAARADHDLVLDYHRHRVRRFEHAADADAARQVDVLAD